MIRGLDGPRIRVLQNGIGTLDASVTSPDHAVVSDALQAERVEIVRGAATLLYSSAAIGGVVNVDGGRIPRRLPDEWLEGNLRALYGSAADEKPVPRSASGSNGAGNLITLCGACHQLLHEKGLAGALLPALGLPADQGERAGSS